MTKVCRLCLIKLQRGSRYFNINAVESFTGFMPYRDQLTTLIPEMALDLIPSPVICNNCRTALKSAYDFKNRCLLVEKKIQSFIEDQNLYEMNYDLSKIPTDDLPPLNKFSLLAPSSEEDIPIRIKKDLFNESVQNTESSSTESNENVKTEPKELFEESLIPKNIVHRRRPYRGGRSHGIFNNDVFTCDFICNFCHESFKSLQALRKHNNICLKTTQTEKCPNILTKRPHLPTKAKNHLKKWLFRHTDHPYPTDQEKQMLMQETNLSLLQVENWFINARRRILQDLTKLKHRGIKTEDIHDSRLGLEMEYEELVPQSGLQNINMKYFATNPLEEITLPPAPENMIKEEFIMEEEDDDMKQEDDEEEEDGEKEEEEDVEVEKWGEKQEEVFRQKQQIEVNKEHGKNEEEIKVDLSTVKYEEIETR